MKTKELATIEIMPYPFPKVKVVKYKNRLLTRADLVSLNILPSTGDKLLQLGFIPQSIYILSLTSPKIGETVIDIKTSKIDSYKKEDILLDKRKILASSRNIPNILNLSDEFIKEYVEHYNENRKISSYRYTYYSTSNSFTLSREERKEKKNKTYFKNLLKIAYVEGYKKATPFLDRNQIKKDFNNFYNNFLIDLK